MEKLAFRYLTDASGAKYWLIPEDEYKKHFKTEEITDEPLNLKLRRLRKQKGLTQKKLSIKSGITQAEISRIETGKVKAPHGGTIIDLLEHLE